MSGILVNFRDQYCNADWFYNDFYANDLHINVDKWIHNQDIYKYNRFVLQLYINKSTSVCFKLSSLLFWQIRNYINKSVYVLGGKFMEPEYMHLINQYFFLIFVNEYNTRRGFKEQVSPLRCYKTTKILIHVSFW